MRSRRGRPLLRTGMVGGTDRAGKQVEQARRGEDERAVATPPTAAPAAAPVAPAGGLSDPRFVG
jgi:hypothetical protein